MHLMCPDMAGARVVVAAGSRDHVVYVWRKRASENGGRSMRQFITTELSGHVVCMYMYV